MARTTWLLSLVVAALLLLGPSRATAQYVQSYYAPPAVTCYSPPVVYAPAPAVSYYYTPAPAVSYYTPTVSYYTPAVSYYPSAATYYAPSVSYYAAPGPVVTTRYGLFGRPRYSVVHY
jgi:hypothetical protein